MLRIAIIDDEQACTREISRITDHYFRSAGVAYMIKAYQLPGELIWDIEEGTYFDIYLLDIEMPTINGMELAYAIRQKYDEPYIIFITSYVEYSIRGYEYHAWRYITKDKVQENLPLAFDGLMRKVGEKNRKFYIFELHSKITKLLYNDIYYLHKDGKYTEFCTALGLLRERRAINKVQEDLDDNAFVFTDRSYVVNLRHVITLDKDLIIMRNGDTIPVSMPQFQKVKQAISDYWRG